VSTEQNDAGIRCVIDMYDAVTECVIASALLDECQTATIARDLGIDLEEFEPGATFELDASDLAHIKSRCAIDVNDGVTAARLRKKLDIDDLPYRVHTNCELLLMLENRKPLAVFSTYAAPIASGEAVPEHAFEPYVASGRLVKREVVETLSASDGRPFRRVFYALPSEVWRVDAYVLLMHTAQISGWSEALERMEGSLLGYNDEQNDAYLQLLKRRKTKKRPEDGPQTGT
jgi:hypothetical protein